MHAALRRISQRPECALRSTSLVPGEGKRIAYRILGINCAVSSNILAEYHISNSNYWPSKALEYTLHCFLLFRLQSVYESA